MVERIDFVMAMDLAMDVLKTRFRDTMNTYDLTHRGHYVSFETACEDFIDIVVQYAAVVGDLAQEMDMIVGPSTEYEHYVALSLRDQIVGDVRTYIDECDYFDITHPSFNEFANDLAGVCADLAYWIARQFIITLQQIPKVEYLFKSGTIWPYVTDVQMVRLPHRPTINTSLWLNYDF